MTSQADKWNVRSFKGASKPAKRMTRDEALAIAASKNASADGRKAGTFGSGLFRVMKDGPLNAPFWQVVEVRA